jgi:predicted amidohydrolase
LNRDSVKVAALQIDCAGSLQELEKRAVRMIRKAAELGATIACLPEHWIPSPMGGAAQVLRTFQRAAKEFQIYVISGAEFAKSKDSTMVESFLVGPRGLVGVQQKVHLFGRERKRAKPGNRYSVFKAYGVTFGVAICHDLVYPEVARILALKGAEIIFSPAKINRIGLYPWHVYVRARALENRVPVVSPNFLRPPRFPGGSLIVGVQDVGGGVVYPKVLAEASASSKLLTADLDLKTARRLRRQRLQARMVGTYLPLLQA